MSLSDQYQVLVSTQSLGILTEMEKHTPLALRRPWSQYRFVEMKFIGKCANCICLHITHKPIKIPPFGNILEKKPQLSYWTIISHQTSSNGTDSASLWKCIGSMTDIPFGSDVLMALESDVQAAVILNTYHKKKAQEWQTWCVEIELAEFCLPCE